MKDRIQLMIVGEKLGVEGEMATCVLFQRAMNIGERVEMATGDGFYREFDVIAFGDIVAAGEHR